MACAGSSSATAGAAGHFEQEGTYSIDTDSRWMAAIAMDVQGNIALGYNVSSTSTYPSLRLTGRLATDPPGTMSATEVVIAAGSSPNGSNRYGDYSSMSVDPVDGCTFWFTGQFNTATQWSTRIGAYKFPDCSRAPDFSLAVTPAAQAICAPASAPFALEIGQQLGFANGVTLAVTGNPAGTTAAFSVNPVVPPGSSVLTIGNTGAASAGSYTLEVSGTSTTGTKTRQVALDLFTLAPAAPALTAPAPGALDQPIRPTFTWSAAAQAETYRIQIATDPGFVSLVLDDQFGSATTYVPAIDLASNTTHYWRVAATNPCGAGTWSTASSFTTLMLPGDCPLGAQAVAVYSYGFETGASGWTSSGTGNSWAQSTARVHSGNYSWHANDPASVSDQRLVSPPIALPAGQGPLTFQFWNHQTLEDRTGGCYDGGILEISTNGGATWTQIVAPALLTDPYDGPVSTGYSNPLAGLAAWCGDPQDWLNSIVDVDAYAGQTVQFRFRLGSDTIASREGWYIDDVKVQACSTAGIFSDGFEVGSIASWAGAYGAL
ncbi:MAG: immune inhibitor A [Thermoanaerobaculia bacterium]|nr:immune inhibitor A [Thermoanaerobaculia bacterium]